MSIKFKIEKFAKSSIDMLEDKALDNFLLIKENLSFEEKDVRDKFINLLQKTANLAEITEKVVPAEQAKLKQLYSAIKENSKTNIESLEKDDLNSTTLINIVQPASGIGAADWYNLGLFLNYFLDDLNKVVNSLPDFKTKKDEIIKNKDKNATLVSLYGPNEVNKLKQDLQAKLEENKKIYAIRTGAGEGMNPPKERNFKQLTAAVSLSITSEEIASELSEMPLERLNMLLKPPAQGLDVSSISLGIDDLSPKEAKEKIQLYVDDFIKIFKKKIEEKFNDTRLALTDDKKKELLKDKLGELSTEIEVGADGLEVKWDDADGPLNKSVSGATAVDDIVSATKSVLEKLKNDINDSDPKATEKRIAIINALDKIIND